MQIPSLSNLVDLEMFKQVKVLKAKFFLPHLSPIFPEWALGKYKIVNISPNCLKFTNQTLANVGRHLSATLFVEVFLHINVHLIPFSGNSECEDIAEKVENPLEKPSKVSEVDWSESLENVLKGCIHDWTLQSRDWTKKMTFVAIKSFPFALHRKMNRCLSPSDRRQKLLQLLWLEVPYALSSRSAVDYNFSFLVPHKA